ncbi:MAG: threonine synthase [Bacteroidota bacterium]
MNRPIRMISTRGESPAVSFTEAMQRGLAPDGGLYMPDPIPTLPRSFWNGLAGASISEIGAAIATGFGSDAEESQKLEQVARTAIDFDAPLVRLSDTLYVLELFHGPTLAFKDFGARFMARAFAELDSGEDQDLLILVATSGDTGSAVAHGFYNVPGTRVCLLYPSGRVSPLQEKQMATLGGNITALEVDGAFDDCQTLVKKAFSDAELRNELRLSSANSINIARLLPQSFYYVRALAQWMELDEHIYPPRFVVPSGNFGNLTAGLMAARMGMPTAGFVAATNANEVVPDYLKSGIFTPRASVETLSNAMDVGNPSNFERMLHLFEHSVDQFRTGVTGVSFSDEETVEKISEIYQTYGYIADPHTAVGLLAAERASTPETPTVVLSTAHPAKFGDVVSPAIGQEVPVPARLAECMNREKQSTRISTEYSEFRDRIRSMSN